MDKERWSKIKWIVLDVDGTLTDGRMWVGNSGEYMKNFYVRDGFAIVEGRKEGLNFAIITGRKTDIIRIRLQEELSIQEVHQGVKNKKRVLQELQERHQFTREETLYMGDDINDLAVREIVGIFACPQNSVEEVIQQADVVSCFSGGSGAVREMVERVLKAQGRWENVIKRYAHPQE